MTDTASGDSMTGDQRDPMPGHTPGPWTYVPERLYENRWHIAGRSPRVETDLLSIADVRRIERGPSHCPGRCPEAEANARLIAAAPEMLAALKATEQSWLEKVPAGPGPDEYPNWHRVRAAIAKATGDKS